MTVEELAREVEELEQKYQELLNTVAQLREDIFGQMATRLEMSKAMNTLLPKITSLENQLQELIDLLKSKGVI